VFIVKELKEGALLDNSVDLQIAASWVAIARKQKTALDLVVANLSRLLAEDQFVSESALQPFVHTSSSLIMYDQSLIP
jgi:hypothetical protein